MWRLREEREWKSHLKEMCVCLTFLLPIFAQLSIVSVHLYESGSQASHLLWSHFPGVESCRDPTPRPLLGWKWVLFCF